MKKIVFILLIFFVFINCQTVNKPSQSNCPDGDYKNEDDSSSDNKFKIPSQYNFKFIVYSTDISNPEDDRRTYYKLIFDKSMEERTTTGLESQGKSFQGKFSINRHLLRIEKWVLDKKESRYVKLNNIDQPKPNYIYFNIERDKITLIKLTMGQKRRAEYKLEFETE